MPIKLKTACRHPGCSALTHNGYCDKHRIQHHRDYRLSRTDTKEQQFYESKEWREASAYHRSCYPVCQACGQHPSVLVHHIETVKDNWGRRMDPMNWQAVCRSCQAKAHR